MSPWRGGIIALNKKCELYVSIVSENPKNIFLHLPIYEQIGVSGIHFDVMDGSFVPRFGLYPELMQEIRNQTLLPIEVHLMVTNPEPYIEQFVEMGASRIIVHIETLLHPHRIISLIKKNGVESGVALNPSTTLGNLEFLLDDIDLILLMAINPGIPKHNFIPKTFDKLIKLKSEISKNNLPIKIGIDGGVTFENAKNLSENGADILICGSGTIFSKNSDMKTNISSLKNILASKY
jgi:ribulose-phosphate 3-epimerase